MARRNRGRRTDRPLGLSGERAESYHDQEYRVRSVAGANATGTYRCPGCDQLLAAGTPHVVAWPVEDLAAEDRRHWHTGCWTARERRGPGPQRSRNAPRYG